MGGLAAAIVLIAGLWSFSGSDSVAPPAPKPVAKTPAAPAAAPKPEPATPARPEPVLLDTRWLPNETRAVLSLRLADLAGQPAFQAALTRLAPLWNEGIGPLQNGLQLRPGAMRRVTWACVDLGSWASQSVVVIELNDPPPKNWTPALEASKLPARLVGVELRRLDEGAWRLPFAVIDERLIVTGPLPLLEELGQNETPSLESQPLHDLLTQVGVGRHATFLADMDAVRAGGFDLPGVWLDLWDSGRADWRTLYNGATGVSLGCDVADPLEAELHLICQSDTAAQPLLAALRNLTESAKPAMQSQRGALSAKLQRGEVTAAVAGQMKLLLTQGLETLQTVKTGAEGKLIWARGQSRAHFSNLTLAVIASVPAWEDSRLAAARVDDEANQRYLLQGLKGYDRAENGYPRSAAGPALLPVDRRLSWIATLLPYYDHLDWYEQLQPQRYWNDAANTPITKRRLPRVINPAFGQEVTEAGFPVTHYVGVAGLGADAASLPADDPRAACLGTRGASESKVSLAARPTQSPCWVSRRIRDLGRPAARPPCGH